VDPERWLGSDGACSTWYGVDATFSGEVEGLYLDHNGLSGTVPSVLSKLPSLQRLRLASNALSGAVPNLSGCAALQILFLDH
jgi:hypothetical protein